MKFSTAFLLMAAPAAAFTPGAKFSTPMQSALQMSTEAASETKVRIFLSHYRRRCRIRRQVTAAAGRLAGWMYCLEKNKPNV